VPTMIIAEGGMPSLWLVLVTLVGGSLAAAGANTINCYVDRDIDGLMLRTRERALPAGEIEPERALLFGVALGLVAFAVLSVGANVLSAALAMGALGLYVFVYTLWLKRSSPQNIVIGGAAGAMPPLVGWAAVTGGLDWPALILFGIIFLWTPPHFWALALRYRADYARAAVPMLPVVRGEQETQRQILLYSALLVATSLLLVPVAGMGYVYLGATLALGAGFLGLAFRLWRDASPAASRALFTYSLAYLALLFAAMGLDRLVA
ncbi:MAG: heme o synthase, partial [Dehalococcoidia bacterium]|nr:heme o synthase [Dehalococcoidia bacterium]